MRSVEEGCAAGLDGGDFGIGNGEAEGGAGEDDVGQGRRRW